MSQSKKYIFITGGVASSLGKGLVAASVGTLLERAGVAIRFLKMDPYINVDPGTMSPTQHGEVFVTDDGAETDLDLGHYERFTNQTLSKSSNFTSGQVYLNVIEGERRGDYLGKTVQVVPHITDEIKRRIEFALGDGECLIGEIGGTVGDIESAPFLESIRQFRREVGRDNVLFIHLVLVPYLKAAGEFKSKPAQHSMKELRSIGIEPDIVICRAESKIDESILEKISLFGSVERRSVFESIDLKSIYQLPIDLKQQGLHTRICKLLNMWTQEPDLSDLKRFLIPKKRKVSIGVIGKYSELTESYKSLFESITHAGSACDCDVEIVYIDAESDTPGNTAIDGILIPGGFGVRGTEQKIAFIKYARENSIPFFGICLGMQLAVIESARHLAGLESATSAEFTTSGDMVIDFMSGQSQDAHKGGSMRLGSYECELTLGSLSQKLYDQVSINERHRHRLEFNNTYRDQIERCGLHAVGINTKLNLVEVIERVDHPFFIGCQYHPEFKSKPTAAHPLFKGFVEAALIKKGEGNA